jgi:hypothetical protein
LRTGRRVERTAGIGPPECATRDRGRSPLVCAVDPSA